MATLLIPTDTSQATLGYLLADGTIVGSTSQAQDFGSTGILADVIAESTSDTGVTIETALLKDDSLKVKNIGVGGSAVSSTAMIAAGATDSTISSIIAGTFTHSGSASVIGINTIVANTGTGANITGIQAVTRANSSSNATNVIGMALTTQSFTGQSGTITNFTGLRFLFTYVGGGSKPTNATGIDLGNMGNASVDNVIALKMNTLVAGGVSTYQIQQKGTTGLNVFGGNTGIGATTDPAATLDVTGNTIIDGDTDETLLTIQANGTQTNDLFVIEEAGGTGLFTIGGDPADAIASASGAIWDWFDIKAHTQIISGSTGITTATGFNLINIGQPTLSAASALTVTHAASLYIANSPTGAGAGPATITNAYALWVDGGNVRLDGVTAMLGSTPVSTRALNIGDSTNPQNTVVEAIGGLLRYDGSSATNVSGLSFQVQHFGSTASAVTVTGLDVVAGVKRTAGATTLIGITTSINSQSGSTGGITAATNLRVNTTTWSGDNPTTITGVDIKDQGDVGATDVMALDIQTQTEGTNTWNIRQRGLVGKNEFNADTVFNEGSSAASDFRVEGNTDADLLMIDAGLDRVGIGIAATGHLGKLHIDQSATDGAEPVLFLDQADLSEQCIQFSSDAADRDINLFTVNVTGTPKLLWDESEDDFNFSAGVTVESREVNRYAYSVG